MKHIYYVFMYQILAVKCWIKCVVFSMLSFIISCGHTQSDTIYQVITFVISCDGNCVQWVYIAFLVWLGWEGFPTEEISKLRPIGWARGCGWWWQSLSSRGKLLLLGQFLWTASQVAQVARNSPAKQEMQVGSLGHKDPLEKEMANPSSSLNPRDLGVWWTALHGIARVRLNLATKPPPCLTFPRVLNTDRLFTVPACCLLWGIHTLFYKVFTHTDLSCKAGWVVPKRGNVRVGVHAVFRVPSQLPWCRSTSI